MEQDNSKTLQGGLPFQEVEQARQERLVRSVYRVTLAFITPFLSLLLFAMLPERNTLTTITVLNIAGVIPITLLANKLIDFGKMKLGVLIYIVFVFQVLAVNTTIIEGIFPILIPASMILIVLSGMMLSPRQSYLVSAIAGTVYIGTRFFPKGTFPVFVDPKPWPLVYVSTATIMAFIFAAVLNQISVRGLKQALNDATYKLYQINRELEKASERKSRFTSRTSHELRTPLSAMISFTDLALRNAYGPINDRLRNALEHVIQGALHLKGIINDILDLGKIEAGELEIQESVINIDDVICTLEGTIRNAIEEKNLDYSLWVSPDFPDEMIGDEGRICQILVNLTSNAVKFTDKGSIHVRVALKGFSLWSIEVADTGPGIPTEEYENIFQAYRQLQGANSGSKVKGTGLGLAITKNLVELMGGTLEVKSKVGEGTTFTVILPLKRPEETEAT
jgi:signal transduction histidine kinase